MLQPLALKTVKEVEIEEAALNADDVLGNKLSMAADTHRSVLTLLQSVPALAKAPEPSTPHHVVDFIRSDSPLPDVPELETLPIFPRNDGQGGNAVKLENMSQLPVTMLPLVKIKEEDEEDLAEEHLVVVDGWKAFKSSSPLTIGTPSLADSSSEVDELFMPSSPGPASLEIDQLYMEEYQMPRSKRLGGGCGNPSLPTHNHKLSDFLPLLVRPSQTRGPRVMQSPKSQPSSPRTTITMSMLGQPPTEHDASHSIIGLPVTDENPSSDDSIAFAVKTVEHACGDRIDGDDPVEFILKEKLDEKDGLLMDVPVMRPPNEHSVDGWVLPTRLADLLVPNPVKQSIHGEGEATDPRQQANFVGCLKKVKGLQPLQIEMSWIPFKYGRTVPTDEEVADVQNDPCPQLAKGIDLAQEDIISRLSALLDESMAFGSQPVAPDAVPSETAWWSEELSQHPTTTNFEFEEEQQLILTRQDRRRLAGLPPSPETDSITPDGNEVVRTGSSEEYTPVELEHVLPGPELVRGETERPAKRVRFDESTFSDSPADYTHDTRFAEDQIADDSGMFLCDDVKSTIADDARGYFGQFAHDAEGFEPPQDDSGLFLDLHPVHSGNFRFHRAPGSLVSDFCSSYDLDPGLSPNSSSRSDRYLPVGDGRRAEDFENPTADPSSHQPTYHDARAALPPMSATSSVALQSASLSSTHTSHDLQPVIVGPALRDFPATRVAPPLNTGLAPMSAQHSLTQFLALCGKGFLVGSSDASHVQLPDAETTYSPPAVFEVQDVQGPPSSADRTKYMPSELVDNSTLVLPAQFGRPATEHRYMASVGFIQRRALVRSLTSLAVELVEREQLGSGADDLHLVLDCDTAVLFVTLEALPSRGDALAASLTRLSWRFTRLLVAFECYPASWSFKGDKDFADKHVASAWSPPVVKAVKRLRRDLGIAEGIQTKRAATLVEYAFAHTVDEAAAFVRLYGDAAAARDQYGGISWRERLWLTHEEYDGEYDLCGVDGMNLFAASLLLSQTSLEEFLEKSADERLLEYGELVGIERMTRFNVEMARRLEAMQLPPSSPISGNASSSSNTVPCTGDSELDIY
ncbi:hypothetical protein OH77DRAFT_1585206 [Trametes cingulata]|nr:hypothetical protein OH77DRAFT_1585206 [Trametes cingulata]